VSSPAICTSGLPATVTATPNPAAGPGITYTYAWTVPAGASAPGNVASFTTSTPGLYSVIVTRGGTECTGTGSSTLAINPNPTCGITGDQSICFGSSSTFTATADMTSYAWTGPNEFSADTQSINVSVAGIYYVTITNASGCQSTCSRELIPVICGGPLCTYTQGAYGNSGGKYCDGTEGGISTALLIKQALDNAGGITVGIAGSRSVYMMNSLEDVECIITKMPGGGGAKELLAPVGDVSICSLPNSYLKNGRINNVLLSQTIALALNVNITSPSKLGSQILQAGTLATAKPVGGCGTSIARERVCGHFDENGIWINTVDYTYRTFSTAVIDAITPDGNGKITVAGLLDLANRALADVDNTKNTEDGASLSDIAGAVGAINEVFDECAIFVGYDVEPLICATEFKTTETARVSETNTFTVFPVPFNEQLTVSYNFDFDTFVKIEVFNSKGVLVASATDSNSNHSVTLNITDSSLEQEEVYIVKVTTNRGSSTKTILSSHK
ncbi:MAG TPA: T9SS type A sorting domain-containing protein, partial [Flavobacterium sp.]